MSPNQINTQALIQFMNTVKAAELSNQREIRISIADAKQLSSTIGLAMTRLAGDYETLLQTVQTPDIKIKVDGGNGWA